MALYRDSLPQLGGEFFIADGGVETDLIFNHGIDIPEFAAHTLLSDTAGRQALATYFREYLTLAREVGAGFVLNSQTWKAHRHWAEDLGATEAELRQANRDSIDFISSLRNEFTDNVKPIVLDGIVGPRGDAYSPDRGVAAHEAEDYHAQQLGWLAETDVDMVTATTFAVSEEAVGVVRAAKAVGLPVVVSFTVETNGALPSGQSLSDAIRCVDKETNSEAAYFGVNCAHPDHFFHVLEDSDWTRRIRALRCNASCKSHAELDQSATLDAGDPPELGRRYAEIKSTMPWINIFGGCCGSDLRHVKEIARALAN
jgi:S-methylmethionine-dependent homocysteine/selenocysteine methylase